MIARPEKSDATLTGPIAGTPFLALGNFDAAAHGYVVEEYFLSGTAQAFRMTEKASPDGHWRVEPTANAPFFTRLVVVRPVEPERFSGLAVVEWLNVTAGSDGAPDWLYLHREILRGGHAYVGVSVQRAGLEGGLYAMPGVPPLKQADPGRYGSLAHPGDGFAYDIYSQAARAIRHGAALGPLSPSRMLAVGESQSAGFLTTYLNAIAPRTRLFDGYLVHSRFRGAARVDGEYVSSLMANDQGIEPPGIRIRSDLDVPVLVFLSETDLMLPQVGYLPARQSENDHLRVWEVAGTAHADTYLMGAAFIDNGNATPAALAQAMAPTDNFMGQPLGQKMNSAPQHHYVLQAALTALDLWVATGRPPTPAPRLATTDSASPALALDDHGNALGGIRTPWVDLPVARLSGLGQPGGGFAILFGVTEPFDAEKLARLYPGGRKDYLRAFAVALDRSIADGHILSADREEILAVAALQFEA